MNISTRFLVRGAAWTMGAYGVGQLLRLVTNIILARLLAPELFGIMVIVNSLRVGIELISDVGIGQNIVHNPNAEKPEFYNTAWTLRLIRGVLLLLVFLAVAVPLAHFYEVPILASILPLAGLLFVISALDSIAVPLLQKRMRFVRLNTFEAVQESISSAVHVLLAFLTPTVWALVFGNLIATAARSIGTYFLLPGVRPRLHLTKEYVHQIFSFGKWIFVSSIIYFLSTNFDRLYFGKFVQLDVLGVYGIARVLSEFVVLLVLRLTGYLVFPLVAASAGTPRRELRSSLAMKRLALLVTAAIAIAALTTIADVIIKVLYDHRYQAAGWMLPLLFLGAWFSVLSSVNEATLLGFGKPLYGAAASGLKFAWLLIGFPLGFAHYGVLGAIVVVATADFWRYLPTLAGAFRERFSFARQDVSATLLVIGLVMACQWLRWSLGFGTSFDSLIAGMH